MVRGRRPNGYLGCSRVDRICGRCSTFTFTPLACQGGRRLERDSRATSRRSHICRLDPRVARRAQSEGDDTHADYICSSGFLIPRVGCFRRGYDGLGGRGVGVGRTWNRYKSSDKSRGAREVADLIHSSALSARALRFSNSSPAPTAPTLMHRQRRHRPSPLNRLHHLITSLILPRPSAKLSQKSRGAVRVHLRIEPIVIVLQIQFIFCHGG